MASVHALEGIIQEGEGGGSNYFKYCSWKCNRVNIRELQEKARVKYMNITVTVEKLYETCPFVSFL